MDEISSQI